MGDYYNWHEMYELKKNYKRLVEEDIERLELSEHAKLVALHSAYEIYVQTKLYVERDELYEVRPGLEDEWAKEVLGELYMNDPMSYYTGRNLEEFHECLDREHEFVSYGYSLAFVIMKGKEYIGSIDEGNYGESIEYLNNFLEDANEEACCKEWVARENIKNRVANRIYQHYSIEELINAIQQDFRAGDSFCLAKVESYEDKGKVRRLTKYAVFLAYDENLPEANAIQIYAYDDGKGKYGIVGVK